VGLEEVIILAREEDRRHGPEVIITVQVRRFGYDLGAEEGFIRKGLTLMQHMRRRRVDKSNGKGRDRSVGETKVR
jgi:hypothetical protein